jgi:energy-coupling factor transporter ATP-binding protein EcfA2
MSRYVPSQELVTRVARGEMSAIGRLISRAEAGVPEARQALATIYQRAGGAHIIGLTGVPGSGKSTLVATLTAGLRAAGSTVGIVTVDPSSPYSGGAILGDRIRMSDLAHDPGVYIRSMATRGATGGLARAALDAVDKDRIVELSAIRDQAHADAERAAVALERVGPAITPESLRRFALSARRKLRNEDGTYRRDHLRAVAQRVEVVSRVRFASSARKPN